MSPRTLPNSHKSIRKMKHRAQEQADRDQATFAVVEYQDLVFIRPDARARHLCEKHPDARILTTCSPTPDVPAPDALDSAAARHKLWQDLIDGEQSEPVEL